MFQLPSPRLHRRVLRATVAAAGVALLLAVPARAQTVQMFEYAPSIEQLRGIMIPESHPGLSRSIVLQRAPAMPPSGYVQPASVQVEPAQAAPVVRASEKPVAAPSSTAVGFRINFGFNSSILPDNAHAMIETVAQLMLENPDVKVRVEGHTDAIGGAAYNMVLSGQRARSVAEYMVKMGVDPSRLIVVGKGMTDPLTANPSDPANRRVQFVRVG